MHKIYNSKLNIGTKDISSKFFNYYRIMKRRKVNKKDFVDSNAGFFFGTYLLK